MSRTIWITGASGYIGRYLVDAFSNSKDFHVIPIGGRSGKSNWSGDLTSNDFVCQLITKNGIPDIIIHCAGNKNVKWLETNKRQARIDNAEMVVNLCRLVPSAHFIFISTDHVFDGVQGFYKESHRPNPHTIYGKSKYLAERYLRLYSKKATIVRTSAVFGRDAAFPAMLLSAWSDNKVVSCFSDVFYSPLYLPCFYDGLAAIIDKVHLGTVHLGGERCSRVEFAQKLANVAGVSSSLVDASCCLSSNDIFDLSLDSTASWDLLGMTTPKLSHSLLDMWSIG